MNVSISVGQDQIAIINQINDDKTLFRFFSTNKYCFSIFKNNKDLILQPRLRHLTDQPISNPYVIYKDYVLNKNRNQPFHEKIEENHTALSYMVFRGNEKAVAAYLKSMPSRDELRHTVRHDYNILHLAILSNNPKMVALILAQPESKDLFNETDDRGDRAIHFVAKTGNCSILKLIVESEYFSKEDINVTGHDESTPLLTFCDNNAGDNTDFLKELTKLGAKFNYTVDSRHIPADRAIQSHKPNCAKILLETIKHHIKKILLSPEFMLSKAIRNGYTDIVKILAYDCKVEVEKNCIPDKSLLVAAVQHFDLELINIVFQLEVRLYPNIERFYGFYGHSYELPKFDDYMLGAFAALLKIPANRTTLDVYKLLLKLGLNTSMVWHNSGCNIFHFVAANLQLFIGDNIESVGLAKRMVLELIKNDDKNYKNKANVYSITPAALLPGSKNSESDVEIVFENRVEQIFDFFTKSAVDKQELVNSRATTEMELFSHDDPRCTTR